MRPIQVVFSLLIISLTLSAQSLVIPGGTLKGTTRWQGTVRIQGDVTIPSTGRLIIDAGSKILFEPTSDSQHSGKDKNRVELIVRGIMIARGKIGQKITFTSSAGTPRMADWYGIRFNNVKNTSIIDFCVIEYAMDGVTIKNSKIQVSNSEIRYNYNSGIKTEVKARPRIARNIISENDYAGVICRLGAKPILTDNMITLNRIGLVTFSLSQPDLGSVSRDGNSNPGRNRLINNEEYDLYNHSSLPIIAENNSWTNDRIDLIKAHIYDDEDNPKYGAIDIEPLYKPEVQNAQLDNFLALTQNLNTAPGQRTRPSFSPATNQNNLPVNDTETQATNTDTVQTIAKIQANDTSQSVKPLFAGSAADNPDQARQIEQTGNNDSQGKKLLLASTELTADPTATTPDIQEQINYDAVFMEPFLDGGKKSYIKKHKIKMNDIIRSSIQPGTIRLKLVVNKLGKVSDAQVLKGLNPILNEAALAAVRQFRYVPGKVNNHPVQFSTLEVFVFK